MNIYQKTRKITNKWVKCSINYQRKYLEPVFKCAFLICWYSFTKKLMLTNMPLSLRRVCELKQSREKKNSGNFSFIKSIISFAFLPNYHVDSKAINWSLLVNAQILLVDTKVKVPFHTHTYTDPFSLFHSFIPSL